MNARSLLVSILVSVLTSGAAITLHTTILARKAHPDLALVDIRALVQLKEGQIATLLVKHDLPEPERAAALQEVTDFGRRLDETIRTLANECHCLLLARGAVIGAQADLPDLTAEIRRRLGL